MRKGWHPNNDPKLYDTSPFRVVPNESVCVWKARGISCDIPEARLEAYSEIGK